MGVLRSILVVSCSELFCFSFCPFSLHPSLGHKSNHRVMKGLSERTLWPAIATCGSEREVNFSVKFFHLTCSNFLCSFFHITWKKVKRLTEWVSEWMSEWVCVYLCLYLSHSFSIWSVGSFIDLRPGLGFFVCVYVSVSSTRGSGLEDSYTSGEVF